MVFIQPLRRHTLALVAALAVGGCAVPDQPYFDLTEELPLAEAASLPDLIDFGEPDARAYLGAGWSSQDERWAGTWSFVWATQPTAVIRFQAFDDSVRVIRFRGRPVPAGDGVAQSVSFVLNGQDLGTLPMPPGSDTNRVRVPKGILRPGENVLELRHAHLAEPTVADTRPLAMAWDWLRFVRYDEAPPLEPARVEGGDLFVPIGTRLDYFVDLRAGSSLRLAAAPGRNHPGARVALEMLDVDNVVDARELPVGELDADFALALDSVGPARLSLRVLDDPGSRGVWLDAARLEARPVEVSGEAASASSHVATDPPPNVIVYLVDTLRADHLGVYGYDRGTSPRLDALASEAMVFERGFAHSGWTRTSVTSLLTGLGPLAHGVFGRDDMLAPEAITLPALLGDLGYDTLGIVTNGNVSPTFGFDNGFDTLRYLGERPSETYPEVHYLSDEVNEAFLRWLDGRDSERPFFAYLHTTDPHSPYTPRSPYRERFLGDRPGTGVVWPRFAKSFLVGQDEVTDQELRDELVALYDAEIAFNDEHFGRLLDALRERGLYEDTVIVFTSDHGEEFLEHGRYGHGKTLYRELVHVPLVVRLPAGAGAGTRPRRATAHVDLLPTLLQLAGGAVPAWAPGASFLPLVDDPTWDDHPTVRSYLQLDTNTMASLVRDDWHLLRVPMRPERTRTLAVELFDLGADFAEHDNLRDRTIARTGTLLTDWARIEAGVQQLLIGGQAEIDPELADRLRDLGYIQ